VILVLNNLFAAMLRYDFVKTIHRRGHKDRSKKLFRVGKKERSAISAISAVKNVVN
jgi:hypothetical protein